MHNIFGGKITTRGCADGNRRILYKLEWNAKNSKELLEKIYPYLIVKKSQVRLALEFPLGKHGLKRTQWLDEKQKFVFEELKLMKRVIDPPILKYANKQEIEHQEMLKKKQKTVLLKKENPNLTMKELGDLVGVSSTMICNYLEKI